MMLCKRYGSAGTLKNLWRCSGFRSPVYPSSCRSQNPPWVYTQVCCYVDVYMRWKKDSYYDSVEHIHHSIELNRVVSLKNCIARGPDGCIPISDVSKRGLEFGIPIKVARFLRLYPSVFEEFTGPQYSLPWFRLTPEAAEIDREEQRVCEEFKEDLRNRLRKFILMSKNRVLPLKIIQGMQWYLGLPDAFLHDPEKNLDESFRVVDVGDGLRGLAVDSQERVLSVLQKNALKRGLDPGDSMEAIEFPFFPSKGVRMRKKIEAWLMEFQKTPYVSPYDDCSNLDPDSDVAEKRVVGVLHELLSLFVEHSAERKKLLCLKKYLGLPQKVHKAFERHPHVFYLSLRNKTCTAILKEAYNDKHAIERHPMLRVRQKYIKLMKQSAVILKKRRTNNRVVKSKNVKDLDLDYVEEVELK
ncbi:protein WHAT'S THIS FACTOR 9, mitochondrial [Eucalyptus grandis]|uniref:protein WHAT'S THIS FACTOR 9, mitochondrial n=1 Tax=Eucalyptus grandis TaxID=71139 RepID=UPI00192E7FCE|nr:protein WHAT'S THIS FACTOR 9, mitochondrial [Eucalyptus grandis]XP_039159111.1 protein WHAT'S THIS FACTOR 9, mitochondrial [Eucalyptus grandis]XP_039159112.1 protein WHAT'S THIS FACTOR 9, mitochondrial [Eucalyptus grandis]XP_039159113.1 protein WHAT'S THIS FACTOR 9, mitochondrial [Eucalyptus grandis]